MKPKAIRESYTRFVERVTYFGPVRSLPIRWRLAASSALLTLTILSVFALAFATLITSQISRDFNAELQGASSALQQQVRLQFNQTEAELNYSGPRLDDFASAEQAAIRIVTLDGEVIRATKNAPNLGFLSSGITEINGYRVSSRPLLVGGTSGAVTVQYARPLSQLRQTVRRIRVTLAMGVLSGSLLALLAGLLIARRAMAPVNALTGAAGLITRTRDLSQRVPEPHGEDEIAQLALTLNEMLTALESSRSELEGVLHRQQGFVADASHELRTPLTSVLANLELLRDELSGEDKLSAESAYRSALRMRTLVNDLLTLARFDARPIEQRESIKFSELVQDAADEITPLLSDRTLSLKLGNTATVTGVKEDLYRAVLNLLQNAVTHTPDGTAIEVVTAVDTEYLTLTVSDSGSGIDPELLDTLFERFVHSSPEHGSSSGLGLAIVKSVALAHGGAVKAENSPEGGATFTLRIKREL